MFVPKSYEKYDSRPYLQVRTYLTRNTANASDIRKTTFQGRDDYHITSKPSTGERQLLFGGKESHQPIAAQTGAARPHYFHYPRINSRDTISRFYSQFYYLVLSFYFFSSLFTRHFLSATISCRTNKQLVCSSVFKSNFFDTYLLDAFPLLFLFTPLYLFYTLCLLLSLASWSHTKLYCL